MKLFSSLETGDFLFIDSSHIVKCGSDLQLLMFEILPLLQPGVFVHFHDVFYPFDYPSPMVEGRDGTGMRIISCGHSLLTILNGASIFIIPT